MLQQTCKQVYETSATWNRLTFLAKKRKMKTKISTNNWRNLEVVMWMFTLIKVRLGVLLWKFTDPLQSNVTM